MNEGVRVASRRVSILIQRVASDVLRSDLKRLADEMGRVLMAKSQAQADAALASAYETGESVMEHIGAVLRSLFETTSTEL